MRLTVGIATWNRCGLLKLTIESLLAVPVPGGVERRIIVCDNNSSDATAATVKAFEGAGVRYLLERKQGLSNARNALVEAAAGDWLLFADDDMQFAAEYLSGYAQAAARYPEAVVLGGPIRPWIDFDAGKRDRFLLENFPWIYGLLDVKRDCQAAADAQQLPHGGNMAFRRDALGAARFDPNIGVIAGQRGAGEETRLIRQLLKQGGQCWLLSAPAVNHYIPRERAGLRHYLRWSKGQGKDRLHTEGPLPRGRGGGWGWVHRLMARRLIQVASHYPRQRKVAYELLGEVMALRGHLEATRQAARTQG